MKPEEAFGQIQNEYRTWGVKITETCPFKDGTAYLLGPTLGINKDAPDIGGIPFVVEMDGEATIIPQLTPEWFEVMDAAKAAQEETVSRDS